MAAYNESAGGGSSGDARDSDALLEEGSADDTSSICSASRESLNAGQLARLKQEASEGDPRAQSELRRLFGPPPLAMKRSCQECGEPFGVGRHQHHCKHCGGAFCLDHANQAHPLSRMGFPYPKVSQSARVSLLGEGSTCAGGSLGEVYRALDGVEGVGELHALHASFFRAPRPGDDLIRPPIRVMW